MVDGRCTKEERACLISLDAVDEARTGSPVCSERFREECMRRCHEGRKPQRGRGPSGRAGRPRWQRGPFWTHMAGPGAWPSRRHPNMPREHGIRQSMSRYADCCSDHRGQERPGWLSLPWSMQEGSLPSSVRRLVSTSTARFLFLRLAAEKLELLSSHKLPVSLCMGGNDERAAFQMPQDEGSSLLMCSFVERGKRLIEKHKP